jgi:hypothetical protein
MSKNTKINPCIKKQPQRAGTCMKIYTGTLKKIKAKVANIRRSQDKGLAKLMIQSSAIPSEFNYSEYISINIKIKNQHNPTVF